jgi:7-cyano-7-deazaguanine tRNA-ribosyltransferase
MLDGLKRLASYGDWLEGLDSASKSTFFYLSPESASRPEVIRYGGRIERISLKGEVLITDDSNANPSGYDHVLNFKPPFGPYPAQLQETYPFNAEVPEEADDAAIDRAVRITGRLIEANPEARFTFRLKINLKERLEQLPKVHIP